MVDFTSDCSFRGGYHLIRNSKKDEKNIQKIRLKVHKETDHNAKIKILRPLYTTSMVDFTSDCSFRGGYHLIRNSKKDEKNIQKIRLKVHKETDQDKNIETSIYHIYGGFHQ